MGGGARQVRYVRDVGSREREQAGIPENVNYQNVLINSISHTFPRHRNRR